MRDAQEIVFERDLKEIHVKKETRWDTFVEENEDKSRSARGTYSKTVQLNLGAQKDGCNCRTACAFVQANR